MSIKNKKNILTKMLISSSLLLSTIGISLALTSCSKSSGNKGESGPNGGDKDRKDRTGFLFNLEPKFVDKSGKDANENNLVAESNAVNLLKEEKGYNKDFFSQVDPTFKNSKFFAKNEQDNEDDITESLGDVVVYYLNVDNVKNEVTFDINEEMLSKSKISKIEELKKEVDFKLFEKQPDASNESFKLLVADVNNYKDVKLTFHGENDKEIESDNEVAKVKKAKISLPSSGYESLTKKSNCLYGLLVSFKSDEDNKNKTVVVKFVKNDDYKYFGDKKFYEDLDVELDNIANNCFVKLDVNSVEEFDKYIGEKMLEVSSPSPSPSPLVDNKSVDYEKIATKNGDKWEFKSDDFFKEEGGKDLNSLESYLKNKLSLLLDVEKSIENKALCFKATSLLPKKICTDDHHGYVLCFVNNNNNKQISFSVGNINGGESADGVHYWFKLNAATISSNEKSGKIVAKITNKQLDKDFVNKSVELSLKE